jgi:hypothetical protein
LAAFKVTVPVYPLTDCTGAADAAPDDVTYPTSFVNELISVGMINTFSKVPIIPPFPSGTKVNLIAE